MLGGGARTAGTSAETGATTGEHSAMKNRPKVSEGTTRAGFRGLRSAEFEGRSGMIVTFQEDSADHMPRATITSALVLSPGP